MCAWIRAPPAPTTNSTSQNCFSRRKRPKSSCNVHRGYVENWTHILQIHLKILDKWNCMFAWIHLKPIHVAAAHIIIHSPTKYVHRIAYNGRRMENASRWNLRVRLRDNDGPHFGVQIIAVQIVGQRIVGRTTEHVQEAVVRDHCVTVASGRWWGSDAQYVFVGDAAPANTFFFVFLSICENLYSSKFTYVFDLKLNSNSELVIWSPLCPEKTYIQSRATATGKLQHVGGRSPICSTSSHWRTSLYIQIVLILI